MTTLACRHLVTNDAWKRRAWWHCLVCLIVAIATQGCSTRTTRVSAPKINASASAAKALELYDKNQDGSLDTKELEVCPGILAALEEYDTDGNQQVSKEELTNRIAAWKTTSPAMSTVDCRVTLDGRPLVGATIRFVPEPYLEDALHPGVGETSENGTTTIAVDPQFLPADLKRLRAMNAGTYKVEITHQTTSIPDKYNKKTILGREVSKQTTASPYEVFELKSK
jgi:hypothetical protein